MMGHRTRPASRAGARALAAAALIGALTAPARTDAQPLESLRYVPDITTTLGGTIVPAGALAADDFTGTVTIVAIPMLPADAHISAVHHFANGDLLLAFGTTVILPGAGTIERRDLVRFTSASQSFAVEVRGADVGIPNGAAIDAVAVLGNTILLSLDVSVGPFDDEDVLAINGSNLELFLDLSAIGIDPALDLDGLDIDDGATTRLYLSFDGSGTVDGVAFDDEDILIYDLGTQSWGLGYDGSAAVAHWPSATNLVDFAVELAATATATTTPTATAPAATATFTAPAATATFTATAPGATATATATTSGQTATATVSATTPPSTVPTETATETRVPTLTATATATGPTPTGPTATATATGSPTVGAPCPGDCDGSGEVSINELITLVNIALGNLPLSACPVGDLDSNGAIAINELIVAVNSALNGCPG